MPPSLDDPIAKTGKPPLTGRLFISGGPKSAQKDNPVMG
jgi:hypothetical protein